MSKKAMTFLESDEAPAFFKALSEPNRLAIFKNLCNCVSSCNVSEICKCCDVDQSVVSRHLSQLKSAGLLTSERKGKEVYYSVNFIKVSKVLRELADGIDSCCGPNSKK